MLGLRFPDWETEYFAALLEPDPERSVERVAVAEATLIDRLRDIAGDHALRPGMRGHTRCSNQSPDDPTARLD